MAISDDWDRVLRSNDQDRLRKLIATQEPEIACFKLERHIRQSYMMSELMPGSIAQDAAAASIARISELLPDVRQRIGGWREQRDYDLRRAVDSAQLSAVCRSGRRCHHGRGRAFLGRTCTTIARDRDRARKRSPSL